MISTYKNDHLRFKEKELLTELWSQICNGDKEALSRFYHITYSKLVNYGLKQVSNRELVKDSIQDLFLNIWEHKENLNNVNNINTYLFLSLRHKIFEHIKRQKAIDRRNKAYVENMMDETINNYDSSIAQSVDIIRRLQFFKNVLTLLSHRQKQIIYLKYYDGLTTNEIASVLGIRPQSVYNYISESMKIFTAARQSEKAFL